MGEESTRRRRGISSAARRGRASRTRTPPQRRNPATHGGRVRKKSGGLVRERPAVIFAAIADWAENNEYPVDFMCTELEVSRSGYYAWRTRPVSHRDLTDIDLTARIRRIHAAGHGNPGVRRVRAGLAAEGIRCGLNRIWRLMRAADLQGRHPKAWKRTTIKSEKPVSAPDLIGRNFTAPAPNNAWCGDITYVRTWTGWAYLATVIDLHSRAVVGWAIADHMRTSLIVDALDMARARRSPPAGVIFHSDRGTQYTSREFDEYCRKHSIRRSMGRTGVCWDKACVSYCTSGRGMGGFSGAEGASLSCDEAWVARGGRFEQPDVLVVGPVRGEKSCAVPRLDGGGVHGE